MSLKPNSYDLEACREFYLQYCATKGQSLKTIDGKTFNLMLFEQWCHARNHKDYASIGVDELDSYQAYLNGYRKPKDMKPLSKGTIRQRLTLAKVFLRTLYNKDVLTDNNFEKFELPSLGRPLPKPVLSEQDMRKVIEQASLSGKMHVRDEAIIETYYGGGLRRLELAKLKVDDIDFQQRQLRVSDGKCCRDRYVPISKSVCLSIYQYLKYTRPQLASRSVLAGNTLFLANSGKPYRPTQLSELCSKYIKLASVRKGGSCNQFRHAAATHMVNNGADILHVQDFLGHADISTTQIYVHVSMRKLRSVYDQTHPSSHD